MQLILIQMCDVRNKQLHYFSKLRFIRNWGKDGYIKNVINVLITRNG